jgi:hypothetical protein
MTDDFDTGFNNNFRDHYGVRKSRPNVGIILGVIALILGGVALAVFIWPDSIQPDDIKLMIYKADLHAVRYTSAGVITVQKDLFNLWGWTPLQIEKITYAYVGYVEAGFDLQKISEDDIQIPDRETVRLTLPQVDVFEPVLDDEKSEWEHETLLFAQPTEEMERQVRLRAQEKLLQDALDDGLVTNAKTSAEIFFQAFFENLGFANVEIRFQ